MEVYPNPTQGVVNIPNNAKNVALYNSLGALVEQLSVTNGQIDMSELPQGMYVISAEINGVVSTSKVSKR